MKSPRKLTGEYMFKGTLFGVILYVEVKRTKYRDPVIGDDSTYTEWKKARPTEIRQLKI
jgi:hypothetical protein